MNFSQLSVPVTDRNRERNENDILNYRFIFYIFRIMLKANES